MREFDMGWQLLCSEVTRGIENRFESVNEVDAFVSLLDARVGWWQRHKNQQTQ